MSIIDPLKLQEPSTYLILAALVAYIGNIFGRGLLLVVGARKRFIMNGDVNPHIRLAVNVARGVTFYLLAAALYIVGIATLWHDSRVSGVLIGVVTGVAFTALCLWFVADENSHWIIHYYRQQRSSIIAVTSFILVFLLAVANWIWGYGQSPGLSFSVVILMAFDYAIFDDIETRLWRRVGVDIVGGLDTPELQDTACN